MEKRREFNIFNYKLFGTAALLVACADLQAVECTTTAINMSSGTCNASGNWYNEIHVDGTGTVVEATSNDVTVDYSYASNSLIAVDNNAELKFDGNLTVDAGGPRHAIALNYISYGALTKMTVSGNLTTTADGANVRGIYMNTGSTMEIDGDLIANRPGYSSPYGRGGSSVQVETGATLIVNGKTFMTSDYASGLRSGGNSLFKDNVDINTKNYTAGLHNWGNVIFQKNLTINTENAYGIMTTNGSIEVDGVTEITTLGSGYNGIYATGDNVLVALGDSSTVSPGTKVLLKNTTVTTMGLNGYGLFVHASLNANDKKSIISVDGSSSIVSNATAIYVTGDTSTIINSGNILSSLGNGIDVSNIVSGSIITNNGNITALTPNLNAILGSPSQDTITNTSGTIKGQIDAGLGDDNFIWTGGLIDSFIGNDGSDTAEITSVNYDGTQLLDGGDDVLTSDGYIDTITFSNYSNVTTSSTKLINWEKIVLNSTKMSLLDNALITGMDVNQGLFLTNGSTLDGNNSLSLNGNLDIDSTSIFDATGGGSGVYNISGYFNNAGILTTQDSFVGDIINVTGDYIGISGSLFSIDTYLGDDTSLTDKLVITGNTSGNGIITVRPETGSIGAQTVNGIKIIDVLGTSGAVFTLGSPLQAGAYEYVLGKNDSQNWYLNSYLIPVTPVTPVVPVPPVPIYRPGTSNYVSGQEANLEQGFLSLGTLHERMNEQQVVPADNQTWTRYYGNDESNNGKSRFNYNQHISAFQVGQDFYSKEKTNGSNVHSGVFFDYSHAEVDFEDRIREDALLDKGTGSMEGNSYGIGGYYTSLKEDESYLDVVGMVSRLENKYEDSYNMKSEQKGYRVGISVEAGKKIVDLGKWKLEGQGQLMYQHTNYEDFDDEISKIEGYSSDSLRGRLGVRVYRHLESTKNINQIDKAQVYGVANVIQDFTNPEDVTIGGTKVRENYDRTMLEVGGGFQVPISGNTYIYTDARYDKSLNGRKEEGKVTIGFKTQF